MWSILLPERWAPILVLPASDQYNDGNGVPLSGLDKFGYVSVVVDYLLSGG
jgi:hypothetical protein